MSESFLDLFSPEQQATLAAVREHLAQEFGQECSKLEQQEASLEPAGV